MATAESAAFRGRTELASRISALPYPHNLPKPRAPTPINLPNPLPYNGSFRPEADIRPRRHPAYPLGLRTIRRVFHKPSRWTFSIAKTSFRSYGLSSSLASAVW